MKLKKLTAKDVCVKGAKIEGLNWQKPRVKLKKLKFWGQLGVKLTKFTAKDHSAKGGQLWGFIWQNQGQNHKKFEVLGLIIGAIKSNLKREDWNELWPKSELWYCSSSSLNLWNNCSGYLLCSCI
jgi:hypothetical protein